MISDTASKPQRRDLFQFIRDRGFTQGGAWIPHLRLDDHLIGNG